jgi:deoxycytidylate deaminase
VSKHEDIIRAQLEARKARRLKWDLRFLELAKLVASWSKDPSTQTGAVFVGRDNGIISVGYNGFPQGHR